MPIKNTLKNTSILMLFSTFVGCSSLNTSSLSSLGTSSNLSAPSSSSLTAPSSTSLTAPTEVTSLESSATQVESTATQVQSGYSSAEKMAQQFQLGNKSNQPAKKQEANAPTNVPPPAETKNLPTYGTWFQRMFGKVISITSIVQNGANENFPIVFDLVFVKDPQTYTSLTTITAHDWFKIDIPAIEALKTQTKLLEIREITVIPERKKYTYLVRSPSHVQAGLLFVRMIAGNNLYPIVFDPYKDIDLEFNYNNFELRQNK